MPRKTRKKMTLSPKEEKMLKVAPKKMLKPIPMPEDKVLLKKTVSKKKLKKK